MKRVYEVLFITAIFLLICLVYKGQPRISLNGGQGWDGVYYYKITEQIFQGENPIVGELPFIKRPGTPVLIAAYSRITGIDLLDSATVVNLAGIYLTTILLFFWLGVFIKDFWLKGMLCFLFMMAWYVPLRATFYDPLSTDAWGAVWFLAGILLLSTIRRMHELKKRKAFLLYLIVFSIVVAIGTIFRESNVILFLALFFIMNPLSGWKKLSLKHFTFSDLLQSVGGMFKTYDSSVTLFFLIPLVFIMVVKSVLSNNIVIEVGDFSYVKTLFQWFYTKSLPEFLLGIFNACGPLVMLLPFFVKEIRRILWERQELLFLLVMAFLFGFIGGSDTERIFFMSGFPVLLIWMGFAIKETFESSKRWWLYVLCALQTISFRFFWILPDTPSEDWSKPVPFFGFLGEHFQYLFLYSHHGQHILNSILFLEYVALGIATWYVLSRKSNAKNSKASI